MSTIYHLRPVSRCIARFGKHVYMYDNQDKSTLNAEHLQIFVQVCHNLYTS